MAADGDEDPPASATPWAWGMQPISTSRRSPGANSSDGCVPGFPPLHFGVFPTPTPLEDKVVFNRPTGPSVHQPYNTHEAFAFDRRREKNCIRRCRFTDAAHARVRCPISCLEVWGLEERQLELATSVSIWGGERAVDWEIMGVRLESISREGCEE
eukprot:scaffold135116_cov27-Tisochrysis_lutea.AAC.1